MSFENADEALESVDPLIGALTSEVNEDDRLTAIAHALAELHWAFPLTDTSKCYWLVERSKRQIYAILLAESAHKFRYKDIHQQHRFDNYLRLIKMMDAAFQKALENDTEIFDTDTYSNLFSYITNGFNYDNLGRSL